MLLHIDLLQLSLFIGELCRCSSLLSVVKVAATFTWVFRGYGLKTFRYFPRSKGQKSSEVYLEAVEAVARRVLHGNVLEAEERLEAEQREELEKATTVVSFLEKALLIVAGNNCSSFC